MVKPQRGGISVVIQQLMKPKAQRGDTRSTNVAPLGLLQSDIDGSYYQYAAPLGLDHLLKLGLTLAGPLPDYAPRRWTLRVGAALAAKKATLSGRQWLWHRARHARRQPADASCADAR
jgi:hypothetical protein